MKRPASIVCGHTAKFFAENPAQRHTAVLFRRRVYVASPRHMDAINLAFEGMSDIQKHRLCLRIADGKEEMLFGSALADGTGWEWDKPYQNARMTMYGFE